MPCRSLYYAFQNVGTGTEINVNMSSGLFSGANNCGLSLSSVSQLNFYGISPSIPTTSLATSAATLAAAGYTVVSCPAAGFWLSVAASTVTLSNVSVADATGGALVASSSNITVTGSAFLNNVLTVSAQQAGGAAIGAYNCSSIALRDSVFLSNTVTVPQPPTVRSLHRLLRAAAQSWSMRRLLCLCIVRALLATA